MGLNDIVRQIQMEGEITSDDVLRSNIVKQVLYKESALMSIGTAIIPETKWPTLDAKWTFSTEVDGEFPVPEGAIALRSKPVEWVQWGATMQMAEYRFMITDFAKARMMQNIQFNDQVQRGAEYFAEKQDYQILDALYTGAGATSVTVGAGNEWDANASTTDIEGDLMSAWNYLVDESNIKLKDMGNVSIVYPAKVDGYLRGLKMIGNVNQSMMTYLKKSFGWSFYPTRYYNETTSVGIQDDALMIVAGNKTARHGVYNGNAIPLSETWRVHGRGTEFLTKKLFFTKIQPESSSVTTSYRICKIANVI